MCIQNSSSCMQESVHHHLQQCPVFLKPPSLGVKCLHPAEKCPSLIETWLTESAGAGRLKCCVLAVNPKTQPWWWTKMMIWDMSSPLSFIYCTVKALSSRWAKLILVLQSGHQGVTYSVAVNTGRAKDRSSWQKQVLLFSIFLTEVLLYTLYTTFQTHYLFFSSARVCMCVTFVYLCHAVCVCVCV